MTDCLACYQQFMAYHVSWSVPYRVTAAVGAVLLAVQSVLLGIVLRSLCGNWRSQKHWENALPQRLAMKFTAHLCCWVNFGRLFHSRAQTRRDLPFCGDTDGAAASSVCVNCLAFDVDREWQAEFLAVLIFVTCLGDAVDAFFAIHPTVLEWRSQKAVAVLLYIAVTLLQVFPSSLDMIPIDASCWYNLAGIENPDNWPWHHFYCLWLVCLHLVYDTTISTSSPLELFVSDAPLCASCRNQRKGDQLC